MTCRVEELVSDLKASEDEMTSLRQKEGERLSKDEEMKHVVNELDAVKKRHAAEYKVSNSRIWGFGEC